MEKKANSLIAKNLLNFTEGHWNFSAEGGLFQEEDPVSNDFTV